MRTLFTFLFLSLTAGVWGQTTQRFSNIQLTATPTEAVAASVTNFLQLDGTGIGEKVSPTTLWGAVVLTGTVDTTDITGISTFARSYLDDTTAPLTLTTLGGTTAGQSFFTLTNPSAITFPRINANNTVTARSAADLRRTDLGITEFYPEDYGIAIPGDGLDDLPAVQAAADAASAVTGGVVVLKPGVYKLTTIYDATLVFDGGTKIKASGHYGLEGPNGVTIRGAGRGVTILEGAVGTDNAATGYVIGNKGARSSVAPYDTGWFRMTDLTIRAADNTASETGILVCIAHSDGTSFERVEFGDCFYHCYEGARSRYTKFLDCLFDAAIPFASSGSYAQWGFGDSGPISGENTPAEAPDDGHRFIRCLFAQRDSGDTSPRDIDLTHDTTFFSLTNLVFEDCEFHGRDNATETSIVAVDQTNPQATCDYVSFLRCRFYTYGMRDQAITCQSAGYTAATGHANFWKIDQCVFNGPFFYFINAGNANTAAMTQYERHSGWQITRNVFNADMSEANGNGTKICTRLLTMENLTLTDNTYVSSGVQLGASALWFAHLNNSSGFFSNNVAAHVGTVTNVSGFLNEMETVETAVQAATHPFYRFIFQGNRASGIVDSNFYFPGAAGLDGGANFQVSITDNHFGSGTAGLHVTNLYMPIQQGFGSAPTIASAGTIAPRTPTVIVSGTAAISTITAPSPISAGSGRITVIPTGAFTWDTAGNIAVTGTAVVGKALDFTYDAVTVKWYPSYQ